MGRFKDLDIENKMYYNRIHYFGLETKGLGVRIPERKPIETDCEECGEECDCEMLIAEDF